MCFLMASSSVCILSFVLWLSCYVRIKFILIHPKELYNLRYAGSLHFKFGYIDVILA